MALTKNPDAATLRFDSHQDALYFSRKGVEDSKRWLSSNNLDIAERYERRELELIYGEVASGTNRGYEQFIFRAVPASPDHSVAGQADIFYRITTECGEYGPDHSVFAGITNLIEGPKKVIPSGIWLKRDHQIKNLVGQFYRVSPNSASGFRLGIPEWKGALLTFSPKGFSRRVSDLIQSRPKISKGIVCETSDASRHLLNQLELENLLLPARIILGNDSVWPFIHEGRELRFDCLGVSLGML